MKRHCSRTKSPVVELIERRQLLSVYSDLLLSRHPPVHALQPLGMTQGALAPSFSGFVPSTTSIATPNNQGPQGTNLALAPTGMLSRQELKRELFTATFKGPYTIRAGRTDTEAMQTVIQGAGPATTIRHADLQIRIVTPKDPNTQLGAVMSIFDRNLNSNTVLGFDATAPQIDQAGKRINIDRAGRPNHLSQMSVDVNESAGVYDEAFSQGIMDIRYIPNGKRGHGIEDAGTAVVRIVAQIYAPNTAFVLRNALLNP